MSEKNITKFQNETTFVEVENDFVGFSFFQIFFLIFFLITSIILIFIAVYYLARKKSLDEIRHRLVPIYHFDPLECDEWEDDFVGRHGNEKTKNTLQFYRSMSSPTMSSVC